MNTFQIESSKINGIDVSALREVVDAAAQDASKAIVKFGVATQWRGGTRSETLVDGYSIGGQRIRRKHRIASDEPLELLGNDSAANPQELLMASFNACMLVGYVVGAAVHGIDLQSVEIDTEGTLDLRPFLGLDSTVKPGYDSIHYIVRIKGNGTQEQFADIHKTVMSTSPNRWNLANSIRLTSELIVK